MQKAMEAAMQDPQVSRAVLSSSYVDNLGMYLWCTRIVLAV